MGKFCSTRHILQILRFQIFIFTFRFLQNSLNGKNLNSEEAVEYHLTNFIQEKPSFSFKNGIDKLIDRWRTIVEKNGDYMID